MAASTKHVLTNVERMAGDEELLKLWNHEAQVKDGDNERTVQQAWTAFIEAADAARIADRIPGTTGRTYKAKYAAEPEPEPPAKKTTRRRAPQAAGK